MFSILWSPIVYLVYQFENILYNLLPFTIDTNFSREVLNAWWLGKWQHPFFFGLRCCLASPNAMLSCNTMLDCLWPHLAGPLAVDLRATARWKGLLDREWNPIAQYNLFCKNKLPGSSVSRFSYVAGFVSLRLVSEQGNSKTEYVGLDLIMTSITLHY